MSGTVISNAVLFNACESGNVETVRYLSLNNAIEADAKPYAEEIARTRGHREIVSILKNHQVQVTKPGIDFSGYSESEMLEFAKQAGLPGNITNPNTIAKRLNEIGFDPSSEG